jgi:cyclopropane-fatty-acyl-phospholipid synthase
MLEVRTVQSIGPHYAKTLRTWRKNFLANWDSSIKPMLLRRKIEHHKVRECDAERLKIFEWEVGVTKRKWEVR